MSFPLETSPGKRGTVTVCIPTYNQAIFLAETIRSVLAQTYPVDEIIISDDASTDETQAVCEEFAKQIPHLRYYRQPKNLGIGGNVEFVMRHAKTTFLARVDSDDRILPDYLSHLIGALEKFPEASYAHGDSWQIDGKGNRVKERILFRQPGFQAARDALIGSLRGYRVAGNILCFRCSTLEKISSMAGFDYGEDYFLSVGLARAGYGNVYMGETLAEARVWSDDKGVRLRRTEQLLRGLVRIYKDQIEPACREMGLPLEMVHRARQWQAISYVVVLDSAYASPGDKEKFKNLLIEIGDSFMLRVLIGMFKLHLGFIIHFYQWAFEIGRHLIKICLKVFRRKTLVQA